MKRLGVLIIFSIIYSFVALQAQTVEEALRKGNQQYVLFESERDKGTNMDAAYNLLLDSYVYFKKVVESASDDAQRNAAKARLKIAYTWLEKATIYYAEANNGSRTLQFAVPYVEIPKMAIFRSELLPRSSKYPSIIYYSGVTAYKLNRPEEAVLMFREYLNTGEVEYEKDSYMYLNMVYQAQKNYSAQEDVLEKAHAKYPLALDFLYNLVNVHIATKNMDKLLSAINKILAVDPNNEKVLPIKARLLESTGKNDEALEIYQRLYVLYPNNFEIKTGLARANFNKATKIINAGATIVDNIEYAKVREEAISYLDEAQKLFLQILERQPASLQYMQGLAGVYQYLNLTPEYETLSKIIADKGSFERFPELLAEYRQTHLEDAKPVVQVTQTEIPAAPKPVSPAKLVIKIDEFSDANQNNVIDAGESFAITFTIENQGQGDAFNTRIRLSEQQGLDQYFDGAKEKDGGNIPAGTSKQYTMRYIAGKNLPIDKANINIYAFEANGFDADPAELQVNTMDMAIPRLIVAGYQYFANAGTSITLGSNGKLLVKVRNVGSAPANNVRVNFSLPDNVFKTADTELQVDSISPGEEKIMECDFVVNKRFDKDSIAILMVATEPTKSSYINDTYKMKIGQYLTAANKLTIKGADTERVQWVQNVNTPATVVKSDVDLNIPVSEVTNDKIFVVIIANEQYDQEAHVEFANNDGTVFREYCLKSLGIPEKNIHYRADATLNNIRSELNWISGVAQAYSGGASLIFYYAGHGIPDESSKTAYLLPVDGSGTDVTSGYKLDDLYAKLGALPVKSITIFMDACFSGAQRGGDMMASARGVAIKTLQGKPIGNMVVFSAALSDETAFPYREKGHGLFTYFLLKKLQETKGDVTLGDLSNYVTTNVQQQSIIVNNKSQTPTVTPSAAMSDIWKEMKLK